MYPCVFLSCPQQWVGHVFRIGDAKTHTKQKKVTCICIYFYPMYTRKETTRTAFFFASRRFKKATAQPEKEKRTANAAYTDLTVVDDARGFSSLAAQASGIPDASAAAGFGAAGPRRAARAGASAAAQCTAATNIYGRRERERDGWRGVGLSAFSATNLYPPTTPMHPSIISFFQLVVAGLPCLIALDIHT